MTYYLIDSLGEVSNDGDSLSIETEYLEEEMSGYVLIGEFKKLGECKSEAIRILRQRRKSIMSNIKYVQKYKG